MKLKDVEKPYFLNYFHCFCFIIIISFRIITEYKKFLPKIKTNLRMRLLLKIIIVNN